MCVVDIVHAKDKISDFISGDQLKEAATQLVSTCVKNGAPNTGGVIKNLGMSKVSPDLFQEFASAY